MQSLRRVQITGTGMCVPPKIVTNKDFEKVMDTSDEWIRERTGVNERRFVDEGMGCLELGEEASKQALEAARLKGSDIEALIVATLTPDYYMPGTSALLQGALGMGIAPAMDIRCQCSGFLYGLNIAQLYVGSGQYNRVLVVGVEVHSRILNLSTPGRDVAVLFGDGAGAAIVESCDDPKRGIIDFELHAEGKHFDKLLIRAPSTRQHPVYITHNDIEHGNIWIQMQGRVVFKNAVSRISEVIASILKKHNYRPEDVDQYVVHQANHRITEAVVKHLEVQKDKVYSNIQCYGNCSAASIPIVLDEVVRKNLIKKGDLICMASFGSGFLWGAALLRW